MRTSHFVCLIVPPLPCLMKQTSDYPFTYCSKVTRYSVLENVLWQICLIDGRLKDCSLVAYFDNMIYVYHHALNHFKTEIVSYKYFAN